MKKLICIILLCGGLAFLAGCGSSDSKGFGFRSSNCDVVHSDCMSQCSRDKTKNSRSCLDECEKSRAMCNALKVKGCMQKCNDQYGKKNSSSDACKRNCQQTR
ncbi:hypothetical protein [Helicobacter monodelphidis]|uniref:hypothetical protein n=1 Tax=Helicobacter sp. 15-1451 TaxID=2004995 RepID=UPI0011BDC4A5|nr:hypothetical protein [Helicobacter sp. 15-1451]